MSEHEHVNYKKIYIWLVIMFLISVIGPEMFPDNKAIVLITAFGIAVVKAIMVAGYFMHLAHEKRYIWYGFITSLSLLFLFIIAIAPDIMNKEGKNWKSTIEVVAEPKAHGDHGANHSEHHGNDTHDHGHQGHSH
jgi:caa(3)-type oxidase subunit IV